ncbi:hypothetical protein CANARDRAFT_100865 [[Candida] arabinofermentans NRRL YB-2248]|uniref:Uncharacterized protein n=1 Tax=[Candida] arabinofermentans NRRL YB-2248 TaxID=983967 RepID=A0A1E4SUQ4_9ASCO|nr:hypothetical protein CANARDRAFT_100865 [[Candida] arabinofermentans NRRL YB-2248]
MYLPPDMSRYNKPPANQFQTVINGSILPIQATDPNCIFKLDEEQFGFEHLDGFFKPEVAMRISRTPLLPNDPSTYASLSKFVEQNLRKYHTTMGNVNQNNLNTVHTLPPETIGVQPDGKTEILPIGCAINPLISDPFKNVHLTPGCIATIVDFGKSSLNNGTNLDKSGKLWARKSSKSEPLTITSNGSKSSLDSLKTPKSNMTRTTSTFVSRVLTSDNYNKKFSTATKFLLGCHGRVFNLIALTDDPFEIEVDPPLFKLTVTTGVITAVAAFHHSLSTPGAEKNIDILIGYSTGDVLWFNPSKMKYSRWNKNSKLKSKPIVTMEWSKDGKFAIIGYSDGDIMIFDRDFEDDDNYNKHGEPIKKLRYMKVFKSLSNVSATSNPVGHYKLSNKAITSIKFHPIYPNVVIIACDDGYIRVFDLLTENLTDLIPSYYGGILCLNLTNDGKYLISGGEDDFVSIYEFQMGNFNYNPEHGGGSVKLVTRLQGSKSWVRSVDVDYFKTNNGLLYRIGTVGDDGCIRFYEFQPRNLPKIKKLKSSTMNNTIKRPGMDKMLSSLTINSHTNSRSNSNTKLSQLATTDMSNSKRKLLSPKMHKTAGSVSSLTSSTTHLQQQHHLSLYEIINQDSRAASSTNLKDQDEVVIDGNNTTATTTTTAHEVGNLMFKHPISNGCFKFSKKYFANPVIHNSVGLSNTPVLLPIGEKDIRLGRLSGLSFEEKYVWAFISTGDIIRWTRP